VSTHWRICLLQFQARIIFVISISLGLIKKLVVGVVCTSYNIETNLILASKPQEFKPYQSPGQRQHCMLTNTLAWLQNRLCFGCKPIATRSPRRPIRAVFARFTRFMFRFGFSGFKQSEKLRAMLHVALTLICAAEHSRVVHVEL
jgi:hypothetical protein